MKTFSQYINEHKFDKFITNKYPEDPVKSAVYDYVAGFTTSVNAELRKGKKWDNVTKHLDKAFKDKEKLDVYRTVDWDYMNNIHGITQDNVEDKVGTVIVNKGYMSTTNEYHSPWASRWTDGELILHITSDQPYPYIDVNKMFTADEIDCEDQKEFLLPRGTKLEIISAELKKGKLYDKKGTYQIELKIK